MYYTYKIYETALLISNWYNNIDIYCLLHSYEHKISNRFVSWFCCYSYL